MTDSIFHIPLNMKLILNFCSSDMKAFGVGTNDITTTIISLQLDIWDVSTQARPAHTFAFSCFGTYAPLVLFATFYFRI